MLHSCSGLPDEPYFRTRYAVLREPLGMPPGSERLADDDLVIVRRACADGEGEQGRELRERHVFACEREETFARAARRRRVRVLDYKWSRDLEI